MPPPDIELDTEDTDFLTALAASYPSSMDADDLGAATSRSDLRTDYHLARLMSAGLVWEDDDGKYGLTDEGRSYVVENDLDH